MRKVTSKKDEEWIMETENNSIVFKRNPNSERVKQFLHDKKTSEITDYLAEKGIEIDEEEANQIINIVNEN